MELMVAMAITTIIVTILVGITSVSIDAWQRSRSEVRASRQAKAMVDSMARDFESMVVRRGNSFGWFYGKTDQNLPGPTSGKGMASTNAAELVLFTAATDRYDGKINTSSDKGGDVSCVSYQLAYQDPMTGKSSNYDTFALYRQIVNPDVTFQNLLGQADLETAFSQYMTKTTEMENFVCENVFQFTVTFHVEISKAPASSNGAMVKTMVPIVLSSGSASNQAQSLKIKGTGLEAAGFGGATADELRGGRIKAVEISLTVLTDAGLNQFRARNFTESQKAEFLAKNSYQYTKLVEVPGS